MTPPYVLARALALRTVAAAHVITRTVQGSGTGRVASESKKDSSPVTIADYAVQAFVFMRLSAAFPGDHFIGEENSTALRSDADLLTKVADAVKYGLREIGELVAEQSVLEERVLAAIDLGGAQGGDGRRTWILDSIDGTKGYIARRQYCISLALTDRGEPVVGVLGCPSLPVLPPAVSASSSDHHAVGVLFHAVTGEGAYGVAESAVRESKGDSPSNPNLGLGLGEKVSVDRSVDAASAVFCESVESAHSSHALSARVASLLGVKQAPARMDSQAKYGAMSRGDFHIFMRFPKGGYVENVWDHAAGVIVIEEAGGRVSDGRGRRLNFSKGRSLDNQDGIVATNGSLHDMVIAAVQQALKEEMSDPL